MPGADPPPGSAEDLALLEDAAAEAGAIALSHFRNAPKVWTKPGDSPVTEADLAANDALSARLRAARPAYGWLSEETEDTRDRLSRDRVFIVDPIDGTRAFIAGKPSWAVALAVVEAGRPIAAVVHMPAAEKTYTAHLGGGAHRDGVALAVSDRRALDGAEVLTNKSALRAEHWPAGAPKLTPSFRPSLAYRLCLVAEGRFDACLTFRAAWEWDTAAGALIASEAGARVTDAAGATPRWNGPKAQHAGLIVAPPTLHEDVQRRRVGAAPIALEGAT